MPILGSLSEFPLPEVLLLIGRRTGSLRLLDVPEFGIMDIDFSNGEVQGLRLGKQTFTEAEDLLDKLSSVVQAQSGMFEFRICPVSSVNRRQPLIMDRLVLSLVCYVDEQVAKQRPPVSSDHIYMLENPEPDIWIEPELNGFFLMARQFLISGIRLDGLAKHLNMDISIIYTNLTNLRLLGFIKVIDGDDKEQIAAIEVQEKISRKSNDYIRASRALTEIQKITSRLPAPRPRLAAK